MNDTTARRLVLYFSPADPSSLHMKDQKFQPCVQTSHCFVATSSFCTDDSVLGRVPTFSIVFLLFFFCLILPLRSFSILGVSLSLSRPLSAGMGFLTLLLFHMCSALGRLCFSMLGGVPSSQPPPSYILYLLSCHPVSSPNPSRGNGFLYLHCGVSMLALSGEHSLIALPYPMLYQWPCAFSANNLVRCDKLPSAMV